MTCSLPVRWAAWPSLESASWSIRRPDRCTTATCTMSSSTSSTEYNHQPMQYRELGRAGIKVSVIGFGAWAIGGTADASGAPLGWGRTSDDDSLAAIRRARDPGVNFFDPP